MKYRRLGRTALRVSELCLGTMNFGPLTTRGRLVRDHGPRARARHQLLRHRQPLRRRQGPGRDRDDRRQLVRAGRRPAREGRARDEGVRTDDASGRTTAACRRATSATRATRACAACRPTTSTSTRCTTSTAPRRGTRSGRRWRRSSQQGKVIYVGSSNFAGWHIAQANEAAKRRNFLGLVSEQSLYNLASRTIELEVLPACRGVRARRDPVEPARGRACSAARGRADTARRKNVQPALRASAPAARAVGEVLRRARRGAGRGRARRGCCTRRV